MERPRSGGEGPTEPEGAYEHVGADILKDIREEAVGDQGMKIDRMFFERFEETVREDPEIVKAVESGQWDRVIEYVSREVFDQPEDYYNLEKLRRAAAVDRRLTLREIFEKVFGLIPRIKSKDELLGEEFEKFLAENVPARATSLPAIKHYFKSYLTDSGIRHIVDNRQFIDLATHPMLSTRDYQAVPERYRRLVPKYIKDYVPLNQFHP